MKCSTALKILKELNKHEKAGTIFNSFGNPDKKKEVKKALAELKQAINSHEKLVDLANDLDCGLKYLRQTKAEPYGFGIDRLEQKLQALKE